MVQHIIEMAEDLIEVVKSNRTKSRTGQPFVSIINDIASELENIQSSDFPANKRGEYPPIRRRFAGLATIGGSLKPFPDCIPLSESLISLLHDYGKMTTSDKSFEFIQNDPLRAIIVRDYAELKSILHPNRAWKSSVVMAGSILEAILLDLLQQPANESNALATSQAPKDRTRTVYPLNSGKWKLIDLINVSEALGLLPSARVRTIDQVLRDYRNFVHPHKELDYGHSCGESESHLALGALGSICDHLEAEYNSRMASTLTPPVPVVSHATSPSV